jgi:hypothetical protein
MYAALASQKNHMAVYLTGIYSSERARAEFEEAYRATGKRFDVGKSCVRFKRIDDLPLPLIGETVGSMSVSELIALVQDGASVRKARTKAAGAAATKRGAKKR